MTFPANTRIGRYEIVSLAGAGVKFPFAVDEDRTGGGIAQPFAIYTEKIEVNVPMEDALFALPGSK